MYNKLFTKILDSSIWLEPSGTRIIWLTMIAAMDENGFVQFASVANLAHRARIELAEAQAAVDCLEGPDTNSSDPDHEGRRIERVPGGWMILNAEKYREMVTRAVIQEKTRQRVAKHREKKKTCNAPVTLGNASVTEANACVTPSDTDTDSATNSKAEAFQPEEPPTGQAPNDAQRKKALRRENAKMLLDFLNETAGRSFRATDTNLDLIVSRLSEPDVTPEGCEGMIERQVALWKGTETEEYLQPSTLFGKQKFGGYYDKRDLPVKLETKGNCL
jgi:uncharacterized phage protein (TIGR02220 family)